MRGLVSFTCDLVGQGTSLLSVFGSQDTPQRDALETRIQEAREQLLSYAYVFARLDMEAGASNSEIRKELTESVGREAAILGIDFQESLVAEVESAIDDALSGRPPKYPKWIN